MAGHCACFAAPSTNALNVITRGSSGSAACGVPTAPQLSSSQTISLSSKPLARNFSAVGNNAERLLVTSTRAPESESLCDNAISPSSGERCTTRAPAFNAPKKLAGWSGVLPRNSATRSEEHTSELQSHVDLVCRLLLEKKKRKRN